MARESKPAGATFRLRDARLDEAEAVGDLVRASYAQFEATYPADWQRYFEMVGRMEHHIEAGQVILAERDGVILGTVTFYKDGSQSGQGTWPAGWAGVVRLGVHPGHRGLGIARALTDECIRRCRVSGIATLALHTTEWMAVAPMYERMGFVRDQAFDFVPRPGIVGFGYRLDIAPD